PAYLKDNASTKNGGTLAKVAGAYQYAQFGQWWVSALAEYATRGLAPDFVSIQNEPEQATSYESCLLDPSEGPIHAGYPQALDAVYTAIGASSLAVKPRLLGPEPIGLGYGVLQSYLTGLAGAGKTGELAGIAHHLYTGGAAGGDDPPADSFVGSMSAVFAMAAGKPLFMTEFAPAAPTMLNTAWLIHDAVTVEGVAAYLHWALIWPPATPGQATNWLVSVEDPSAPFVTPKGYTIHDPYYALKHYARWIDEGWTRVDASSSSPAVKVSAFAAPSGAALTVVLLNTDAAAHTVAVGTGSFAVTNAAAYRSAGAAERTTPVAVGPGQT